MSGKLPTLEEIVEELAALKAENEELKNSLDMLSLDVRGGVDNPHRAVELKLLAKAGPEALKELARQQAREERREKADAAAS